MNSHIQIFAILFFGVMLVLMAPWPKLSPERPGEDFALLFFDDGSSDLEPLECSEALPCYVAREPMGLGEFVHIYHYPLGRSGNMVGMSYQLGANGGGGWVLRNPPYEPRAHGGFFHRADPFIGRLGQEAAALGCELPNVWLTDRKPREIHVECELVVTDRAALAYRLRPVPATPESR